MLDHLRLRPRRIDAVEGYDVRIEEPDAHDVNGASVAAGETHADLVLGIELFFELLDVENHPLIGPFGGGFLFLRAAGHAGGQGRALRRRLLRAFGQRDAGAGDGVAFQRLGGGHDFVAHDPSFMRNRSTPSGSRRLVASPVSYM